MEKLGYSNLNSNIEIHKWKLGQKWLMAMCLI